MAEKEYVIEQNSTELTLSIPSTKSTVWEIGMVVQIILFTAMIVLSVLVIVNDFSWATLIMGGLLILVAGYFLKSAIDTFFWIKNGYEFFKIDKTAQTFFYQKNGRTVFDKINGNLVNLSNFKWCPDNDEYIDVYPRYGMQGGKICFWIKNKKHRFAISLSETAARACILELNSFLKHTKK